MSKKIPSGYEKRKKKTEEQEKLLKLPKISSFFSSTIPRENKSEIIIKIVNNEVNSEQSVEFSSVDSEKSEESAPEMLSCCSYKGTNQNESFDIVFKNIIETSSDPTDIGHFKEIVLGAQTKRFIIENGLSRPKAKGPFAKNSDGRSFSEKTLDILINQISKRFSSFHELMLNCTCLQPSFLTSATDLELLNEATKLVNKYDKDISKTFTSEILACTEWWCPVHSNFEVLIKTVKPTSYEDETIIRRAKSRFTYWSKGGTARCCTLDRKRQTSPKPYVLPSCWPTVMPSDMDKLSNSLSKLNF
ncbi:hypothetical protein ACI65C_013602 [Semiaphis heraclei]